MVLKGTLRTKFLLSLALISALLTWTTLAVVRRRVEMQVRAQIAQGLRNSVITFQSLEQQRASILERSAALLASLPPLKAVMTSRVAADVSRVAASQVAFRDGNEIVVSTVSASQARELEGAVERLAVSEAQTAELQLGRERFLATAVRLSHPGSTPVTLTVLKSYD